MAAELKTDAVREALIDRIAQWLHDEAVFPDPFVSRSWPLHDADTGRREGGGVVKLVPKDVVEEYRHIVRRMFRGFSALTASPAGDDPKALDAAAREAGELRAQAKQALYSLRFEGQPMSSMFSAEELGLIVDTVLAARSSSTEAEQEVERLREAIEAAIRRERQAIDKADAEGRYANADGHSYCITVLERILDLSLCGKGAA